MKLILDIYPYTVYTLIVLKLRRNNDAYDHVDSVICHIIIQTILYPMAPYILIDQASICIVSWYLIWSDVQRHIVSVPDVIQLFVFTEL